MGQLQKMGRTFVLVLLFVSGIGAWALVTEAVTPPVPERPPARVVDLAALLDSATRQQLENVLAELERKTGAQLVVLTIQSLDGQDINSFSLETAEKWQLGQKDRDNGLLFTVAVKDRKYRFEVGYGLEEILPDSRVGAIGRRYLVPYFRQGKYRDGITAATMALVAEIARSSGVSISGSTSAGPGVEKKKGPDLAGPVFLLILLLFMISGFRDRKRRRGTMVPWIYTGGTGWSGGDGFGGGFGSGFGGGGGGFGGGGASGGW